MAVKIILGQNDLQSTHPELCEEWDYQKNAPLLPTEVTAGSGKKIWWIGKCGHEWETTIVSRTRGYGCPFCSSNKVLPGYNDLASQYPELLEEWDYQKNTITPDKVSYGSKKMIFWRCYFGHKWQSPIYQRTGSSHSQCPKCKDYSSFAEQALYFYLKDCFSDCLFKDRTAIEQELDIFIPSIKTAIEYDGIQWHKGETPRDLKKALLCEEKGIRLIRIREEGLASILHCQNIIRRTPFTNDTLDEVILKVFQLLKTTVPRPINTNSDTQKIVQMYRFVFSTEKSLAAKYPELVKEWNFAKNMSLSPERISAGSKQKVWWICRLGHEWESSVQHRAKGQNCPFCAHRKVLAGYNDLATTHPALAAEWHPTKNGNDSLSDFSHGSREKVWWKCPVGHDYEMRITDKVRGSSCPYCSRRIVLPGYSDFATEFPQLLEEWDFEKNKSSPHEFFKSSKTVVWWKGKCGHEWQSTIKERTRIKGCPICSGYLVVPGINDLQTLFPKIASELSASINSKNAQEIYAYSKKEYFWTCPQGHTYKKAVRPRTKRNEHCPFCSNKKVLPGYNDLASQRPELLKEWDYEKNTILPNKITMGSHKQVWWICSQCGNSYQTSPANKRKNCRFCKKMNL